MNQSSPRAILEPSERIVFDLRALYSGCGYSRYRMSRFEEYDYYARNKDFLVSSDIITFTDKGGRLMALKPDVTLSIIRSAVNSGAGLSKVYYNENVYRTVKGANAFQEIMQVGLECIGSVDGYCVSEVLTLACRSLLAISPSCVLELSHLGVLSQLLDRSGADGETRTEILTYLSEKNGHDLAALCRAKGLPADASEALVKLTSLSGTPDEVIPALRELAVTDDVLDELRTQCAILRDAGLDSIVRLDFAVQSDMRYYSGIVFKGYVENVPTSVLSGGQYDNLLHTLGGKGGAVGFAVYLDQLERLLNDRTDVDADVVLLYESDTPAAAVAARQRELSADGSSVIAVRELPDGFRAGKIVRMQD